MSKLQKDHLVSILEAAMGFWSNSAWEPTETWLKEHPKEGRLEWAVDLALRMAERIDKQGGK